MLATMLVPIPLAVLPIWQLFQPPRECRLEVLTPQAIEERALAEFNAKVHAVPYTLGVVRRPARLLDLPELPPELGYELWENNLVLLDLPANLVLDVLPDAVLEATYPGVLYQ